MSEPTPRKVSRYGWKKDLPDHRDHFFTVPAPREVPRKVDLSAGCPPIYDQGHLGSCTANAVGALFQYKEIQEKQPDSAGAPSRLFIYYNERWLEGSTAYDSGATIRDSIRALAQWGSVKETVWPYDVKRFADKPPPQVYEAAKKDIITEYSRIVQKIADLRTCLADGNPFVFGFTVYQSFESAGVAKSGVVPMPGWFDRAIGGHAVMAVGYDDDTKRFLVRNSWGGKWGQGGLFTMPYEYLLNPDLASDIWTINSVPA